MILDGKLVSQKIMEKVKEEIAGLPSIPGLAVILVGEDPASKVYVNIKKKRCEEVGIRSSLYVLPEGTSEAELLRLIEKLNQDSEVHGILVQFPVPEHISRSNVMSAISPKKDVDGFNPINVGKVAMNEAVFEPCTSKGVIRLLEHYDIDVKGMDAVIIGNSRIVGNPTGQMLLNREATVTICHALTKDVKSYTKKADLLISAVGKRNLVTADMVKEGAIVVDIGIIKEKGKLYGDVDFDAVKDKASYITPVPGGAGPMTVACLMENTLIAYKGDN